MDDLSRLENWVQPLLENLTPAARRRLARTIATPLRRSQASRIAAQRNVDGSEYVPRKPRLREKKGRIRRAMFVRLRTAKFMRTRADANSAAVEFTGRVARLARVHQEGLEDHVTPGGPRVRYPKRELLGFTSQDTRMIRDLLIEHLAK